MIRFLCSAIFLCLMSINLLAQQRLPGNQNIYGATGRGIIYDNEMSFNVMLATPRNFVVGVRSGKLVAFDKMTYWSASFGTIRDSRERRENLDNLFGSRISRAYVFGKENQLYALRVGFGQRKYLSEKARQRGVAVGYSYEFGPTLGLLKPYYLEFVTGELGSTQIVDRRFDEENPADFLNQDRIFGASVWTMGLDEISLRPGIHAKVAAHFAFGAFDEIAKSLEAGLMADFLLGNTNIMVQSDLTPGVTSSPLFLSLFLNVQLGRRW